MHRATQRKRARRARTRLPDELQVLGRGLAILVAHGPVLDLLPLGFAAPLDGGADAHDLRWPAKGPVAPRGGGVHRCRRGRDGDHQAGFTPHDADTAARVATTRAGFCDLHRNRLGYGIGISYPPDWGEGEIISLQQHEHRPLQADMTFHMPPLCLKYREFGIGFSESVVVTESGCERFSKLPREIVIKV
jgi:hypothetical protein